MVIDWQAPLLGGAMIGVAAAGLMLFNGRISGISGVLGSALTERGGNGAWRWAFLAGLLAGGGVLLVMLPAAFESHLNRSLPLLAIAGVLVGVGTQVGGGCTSGHGVCGIGRLSRRSILVTIVFMTTGVIAAITTRVLGG